jgi:hypothetical protein
MGIVNSGRNVTTAAYAIYLPKTNKNSFKFNEMLNFRLVYLHQSNNFTARYPKKSCEWEWEISYTYTLSRNVRIVSVEDVSTL